MDGGSAGKFSSTIVIDDTEPGLRKGTSLANERKGIATLEARRAESPLGRKPGRDERRQSSRPGSELFRDEREFIGDFGFIDGCSLGDGQDEIDMLLETARQIDSQHRGPSPVRLYVVCSGNGGLNEHALPGRRHRHILTAHPGERAVAVIMRYANARLWGLATSRDIGNRIVTLNSCICKWLRPTGSFRASEDQKSRQAQENRG